MNNYLEFIEITPSLARLMLHQNDPENRPPDEGKIQAFMDLLDAGKCWQTAIVFDNLTLVNGQHRLSAIIRTGHTVTCPILWKRA